MAELPRAATVAQAGCYQWIQLLFRKEFFRRIIVQAVGEREA
jgi:hypothetical protein